MITSSIGPGMKRAQKYFEEPMTNSECPLGRPDKICHSHNI